MQILGDFTTTVSKALSEIDKNWRDYDGLIICGTHAPKDTETMISAVKEAREKKKPFLGICFGHQIGAIEYARNVLGIEDATSEEFGVGTFVVKKLPKLNVGLIDGNTYWNNYEVAISWKKPEYFFTAQFQPEYQSSKKHPHPLLVEFIQQCKK